MLMDNSSIKSSRISQINCIVVDLPHLLLNAQNNQNHGRHFSRKNLTLVSEVGFKLTPM